MKKNSFRKANYFFTISTLIFSLFVAAVPAAQAKMNDSMMSQMMGSTTFDAVEEIEETMMGEENHDRMKELMNKILAGTMTSDEQKEMVTMLQGESTNMGAMSMMMRMMNGQMMKNGGLFDSGSDNGWGMMQSSSNVLGWFMGVLLVTVMILLPVSLIVLVILALWKYIQSPQKK